MVGFGLMDNFIMIQAGDAIDNTFGATLGIATLTAAAFGQVFSDVAGVLFGGVVDRSVTKAGIRQPDITAAQRALPVAKNVIMAGSVVGVTVGCLLGASCLLFMDLNAASRKKQAKELGTILETVMDHGDTLIEAERSAVFVGDVEKNEMWSKYASNMAHGRGGGVDGEGADLKLFSVPMDKSIVGECFTTGKILSELRSCGVGGGGGRLSRNGCSGEMEEGLVLSFEIEPPVLARSSLKARRRESPSWSLF